MALKKSKIEDQMNEIVEKADTNRRATEKPGKLTRRNILLPDNHWKTLKIMAEKEGVNVSILIRKLIKDFIEKS